MIDQIVFHKDPPYVEARTVGRASVESFGLFLKELFTHPDWSAESCLLLDVSEIDTRQFGPSDVQGVSELLKSRRGAFGTGCLAVLTSREVDFGLARMFQLMTEDGFPVAIRIFRARSEALSWIREQGAGDSSQ